MTVMFGVEEMMSEMTSIPCITPPDYMMSVCSDRRLLLHPVEYSRFVLQNSLVIWGRLKTSIHVHNHEMCIIRHDELIHEDVSIE